MRQPKGRPAWAAAIVLCCATGTGFARDDPPQADKLDKAEGVITKVDRDGGRIRLTINTAAVWSDYVRDQASIKPKSKEDGANSIATKGEPASPNTTIVVEITEGTRLANRFRSSTDESNKGSKTVAEAKAKERDAADDAETSSKDDAKAPKLKDKDLKSGQFVYVEARKGKADQLFVLKPIGGPQTPASVTNDPK